jgi:hypothetical protein
MADDVAVPLELGESRGVLRRAIRRDMLSARLAPIPWPHTAPARLALHFYLLSTGRTPEEANARVYGPMDVSASEQFRDDYNSVMLPLHAQVQSVAKQYVESVKSRLSLLHFKLNMEGMPERLSEAAQRIGREAGGLSLEIDQARAQVERAHAKEKAPVIATPPPVPRAGIPFSPEDRKKANEEAAEFRKFYAHVRELARARIGPFVRRDPLLAILFEHPEDESLNVPLGGLSILQAYADSAKADGGASRASSPILALPPSDKRRPPTAEGPASRARSSPTLQSYLPAVSRESHRGTALANALIRHAMGALDQFAAELSAKGNEDHALRYLPFVLGGIEKAGLAKVLGFRQFAVWDCERVARSTEELLDAAGMAIAYVGMFFPVPIGAAVAGTAAFAVEAARVYFAYTREHEQQLAATAGVFLGQTQRWAKPTDYSETTFAALSAAAALAMASVAYLEAASEFQKMFRVTAGRADAGRAAAELAESEASKAASAADPRATYSPPSGEKVGPPPAPPSETTPAVGGPSSKPHFEPDIHNPQPSVSPKEPDDLKLAKFEEPDIAKPTKQEVDDARQALKQQLEAMVAQGIIDKPQFDDLVMSVLQEDTFARLNGTLLSSTGKRAVPEGLNAERVAARQLAENRAFDLRQRLAAHWDAARPGRGKIKETAEEAAKKLYQELTKKAAPTGTLNREVRKSLYDNWRGRFINAVAHDKVLVRDLKEWAGITFTPPGSNLTAFRVQAVDGKGNLFWVDLNFDHAFRHEEAVERAFRTGDSTLLRPTVDSKNLAPNLARENQVLKEGVHQENEGGWSVSPGRPTPLAVQPFP